MTLNEILSNSIYGKIFRLIFLYKWHFFWENVLQNVLEKPAKTFSWSAWMFEEIIILFSRFLAMHDFFNPSGLPNSLFYK